MTCQDCFGSRAVPDDLTGEHRPCPCCVIEASDTFTAWEDDE